MIAQDPTYLAKVLNTLPKEMPQELVDELLSWTLIIKSPYSCSYYNAPVGWNYKEPESLRIANHWNFSSGLRLHCVTSSHVENDTYWTLAKYNGQTGKYDVIKSLPVIQAKAQRSQTYYLAKLDVQYVNAQAKFEKSTIGVSFQVKQEWRSRMELSFLNRYFKILES